MTINANSAGVLTGKFTVPEGITAALRLANGDPATLIIDGKPAAAARSGRFAAVDVNAGSHEGSITLSQ